MKLPNIIKLIKWLRINWVTVTHERVTNWIKSYIRMNKPENQAHEDNNSIYWEKEQFNYRVAQVTKKSPKCLEGTCIHCGCETPDKFWEDAACEQGCYPHWMEEAEWKEFKKTNAT